MERSSDWLHQARGNLEHARKAESDGSFDWACFAAHQAAEMAVKAVYQSVGAQAWGHSVADLLKELAAAEPVPEHLYGAALDLDRAYIPTRDPDAHPSGSPRERYTRGEADRLVGHAADIFEFCSSLLPNA